MDRLIERDVERLATRWNSELREYRRIDVDASIVIGQQPLPPIRTRLEHRTGPEI